MLQQLFAALGGGPEDYSAAVAAYVEAAVEVGSGGCLPFFGRLQGHLVVVLAAYVGACVEAAGGSGCGCAWSFLACHNRCDQAGVACVRVRLQWNVLKAAVVDESVGGRFLISAGGCTGSQCVGDLCVGNGQGTGGRYSAPARCSRTHVDG